MNLIDGYKGLQLILFGSPGVGKSRRVNEFYAKEVLKVDEENKFRTVFHPEYKYGDFVGRLIPITTKYGKVKYIFNEGPFLKALAKALDLYIENPSCPKNVLLIIEELNRGNAPAIFGDIFQLLDRDEDGWSSYEINVNSILKDKLTALMNNKQNLNNKENHQAQENKVSKVYELLEQNKILLPPNFHIIATINTSDESIYFLDSAFKRRWSWEYVPVDGYKEVKIKLNVMENENELDVEKIYITEKLWDEIRKNINKLILKNSDKIRFVEDKQIGKWFLKKSKNGCIPFKELRDKLAFFLWDSVFHRNKEPLKDKLGNGNKELRTYADFIENIGKFIENLVKEEGKIRILNIPWDCIFKPVYTKNKYENKYESEFAALLIFPIDNIFERIEIQEDNEIYNTPIEFDSQNSSHYYDYDPNDECKVNKYKETIKKIIEIFEKNKEEIKKINTNNTNNTEDTEDDIILQIFAIDSVNGTRKNILTIRKNEKNKQIDDNKLFNKLDELNKLNKPFFYLLLSVGEVEKSSKNDDNIVLKIVNNKNEVENTFKQIIKELKDLEQYVILNFVEGNEQGQ